MANQIADLLDRPKEYYNVDGVGEMGIGFMTLGYALFGWLNSHAPDGSIWRQMYTLFIFVGVMVSIVHYGSKAIKNRITYPRTGFVDYRPRDKYWIPMGLGAGVSVVISVGVVMGMRRHWDLSMAGPLVGVLIAVAYIRIATTVRWKWAIFGVVLAGSLAVALLPPDVVESFGGLGKSIPAKLEGSFLLTFVLYGAALLISGCVSFWLYLRHTQPPAQEGE